MIIHIYVVVDLDHERWRNVPYFPWKGSRVFHSKRRRLAGREVCGRIQFWLLLKGCLCSSDPFILHGTQQR